jgi:hypothetical protein
MPIPLGTTTIQIFPTNAERFKRLKQHELAKGNDNRLSDQDMLVRLMAVYEKTEKL